MTGPVQYMPNIFIMYSNDMSSQYHTGMPSRAALLGTTLIPLGYTRYSHILTQGFQTVHKLPGINYLYSPSYLYIFSSLRSTLLS